MPLLKMITQAFAEHCVVVSITYYTDSYKESKAESSVSCGATEPERVEAVSQKLHNDSKSKLK